MEIEVVLTPAEIAALPGRDLRATVCVVFDVLRATSTFLAALAHGARRIYPARTIEEARALQMEQLPGALLAGERGGVRIDGFDLGNSPLEYPPAAVAGRDIISTTTNGTVALRACAGAGAVYAAALVNLAAMAALIEEDPPARLLLVCAGSGASFALEDALAAGGLLEALGRPEAGGDAGRAVRGLHRLHRENLLDALRESTNGARLVQIGLAADVAWCARQSCLNWTAKMNAAGALEGRTRAGGGGGKSSRDG